MDIDFYLARKIITKLERKLKNMKTKLSDIHITKEFQNTTPSQNKLLACMTYYAKTGKLNRDIILTEDDVLVDGYVGYLTLKSLGIKKWKCIRDTQYQWYVQGKHKGCGKAYTWKLPKSLVVDGVPQVKKGVRYWIGTSQGKSSVKVTKVFMAKKPPINIPISNFTFA